MVRKEKNMVSVGQKVQFDPFESDNFLGIGAIRYTVTGTVVEVYKNHKWFSVEYGNPKQRTSFKLCDIGKSVKLVG